MEKTESMYREYLRMSDVPSQLHDGLVNYLAYGIPTGSFLHAVLTNDLVGAVSRADERSAEGLVALVRFLYNMAPAVAWGSDENVALWIEARRKEREQAQVSA